MCLILYMYDNLVRIKLICIIIIQNCCAALYIVSVQAHCNSHVMYNYTYNFYTYNNNYTKLVM